ncbi:MAG: prepilin-type N-terminal cleavage/methylation domain-containing protein [Comamonadaceae bacterium]|nr:MAG: prepilin-type N-terminal cleavage/methylation domain-containing protein [Comamonadaceae bacterium]
MNAVPRRRNALAPHTASRHRGFTLVELLVALSVMAVLAGLSWQGLDGMSRAQGQTRQHAEEVLTLQAGLGQWIADLDALAALPVPRAPASLPGAATPTATVSQPVPLDWDGRALRLTRQAALPGDGGLRVVAWSLRAGNGQPEWLRWESPAVRTRADWQQAWDQAALWAQNAGTDARLREVAVMPVQQWQVFYYRNDAWTNPLSSDIAAAPAAGTPGAAAANSAIPEGVRLVLSLPAGQAIAGMVTRDWVRPTLSGGRT